MTEQERTFRFLDRIIPKIEIYDFQQKEQAVAEHIGYMLNRTKSMFKWSGLPDTIPERYIELYLQVNGNICFYEYENNLYIFTGGIGGAPNVYYFPENYIIANPALKLSKTLTIDKDCIVMPNDTMYMGLIPLCRRYASLLVENELSMSIATINTRIIALLSAMDDRTRESAEKYLEKIKKGDMGIIAENAFLEGMKAQPIAANGNSNFLTNLIEFEQYIKASFFNEIGLNANYNMKRESLNSSESQLNNDALLPLVDDMLKCRQTGAEKVNEMFGTNISVEFASSWEDNEIEIENEQGEAAQDENPVSAQTENGESEDEKNDAE